MEIHVKHCPTVSKQKKSVLCSVRSFVKIDKHILTIASQILCKTQMPHKQQDSGSPIYARDYKIFINFYTIDIIVQRPFAINVDIYTNTMFPYYVTQHIMFILLHSEHRPVCSRNYLDAFARSQDTFSIHILRSSILSESQYLYVSFYLICMEDEAFNLLAQKLLYTETSSQSTCFNSI